MVYDPEKISLVDILRWFWEAHDPTQGTMRVSMANHQTPHFKRISGGNVPHSRTHLNRPIFIGSIGSIVASCGITLGIPYLQAWARAMTGAPSTAAPCTTLMRSRSSSTSLAVPHTRRRCRLRAKDGGRSPRRFAQPRIFRRRWEMG